MRTARLKDHLVCLVVPIAANRTPVEVAEELRAREADLDALFRAHGGVHFSTFTILPPSPRGTPDPSGAALALTLAVDAGEEPRQTLARLAGLAPTTLQAIYGVKTFTALLDVLLDPANLQPLAGGFVGARDRSVAQVLAEGELAKDLRRRAAASGHRADAPRLVAELSAQALADPRFSWARQPAAKGNWRESVTPGWLRLSATAGWLAAIALVALVVGTLAMIGFYNRLVVAALNDTFVGITDLGTPREVYLEGGPLGVWLRGLATGLLLLNGLVIILVRRGLPLVVLELALLFSAIVVVGAAVVLPVLDLPSTGPSTLGELDVARMHIVYGVWVLMGLAALVVLAGGCVLFAWAIVPPYLSAWWLALASAVGLGVGLLALHCVLAGLVVFAHRFQLIGQQWYQEANTWGWQPVDRIAIVVCGVALAVLGAYLFLRMVLDWAFEALEQLNHPSPDRDRGLSRRLHQTAPSITECEAKWLGRPGVMISLTEVRRPCFIFGPAANFFLWLIRSLGWHVFTEGRLGDISSIHYAHWHLVDGGRRLLFCSNFDGDFGGYLDEFILARPPGINVIWRWTCLREREGVPLGGPRFDAAATHARAFPKTRLLLFAGCRSEQQFKAYARESMVPFQYHFAAYDCALGDILRSTQLRDALTAARTPAGDALVMRALEA